MAPAVVPSPVRAAAGLARTFGRTAAGMTLDLASGVTRLGEAAADSVAGRQRSPGVLRVQVLILRDEQGVPLCPPAAVLPALVTADRILTEYADVRVRAVDVRVLPDVPPAAALDPRANRALLLDDVLGRTRYYRRQPRADDRAVDRGPVGAPVTVVVVRTIAGRSTGCSLGASADWVITQAALYDPGRPHTYDETVLAHELGHAVNLPHSRHRDNLMFPESSPPHRLRGTALTGWQRALVHSNRHVVPGTAIR